MHQIAEIEFENCIFLAFEGAISPQTPIFLFSGQNFIVLERASKSKRWEELYSSDNSQYFIIKEKWIFSKLLTKGKHQISQIEYANCIFSTFEGDSPDTPFFSSRVKDFYNSDKGIKTGKVGRIDMKIANIFYWKHNFQ